MPYKPFSSYLYGTLSRISNKIENKGIEKDV